MPVPVIVNAALIVALLILARYLLSRTTRKHNAAWRAFAAARGLAFTPSTGFASTWRSARVQGAREDRPFVIDCYFIRVGRGPQLRTRVSGPGPAAGESALDNFPRSDARFEAYENGVSLSWPGFEEDPAVLDAACGLVTPRG